MIKSRQPTEAEKTSIRILADWACGNIQYWPGEHFPYIQSYIDGFVSDMRPYHPRMIELVGKGRAFNSHTFQRLCCDLLDSEI